MKAQERKKLETLIRRSELEIRPQVDREVLERALARYRSSEAVARRAGRRHPFRARPIGYAMAVALLVLAVSLMEWLVPPNPLRDDSLVALISSACAAEQALFAGDRIVSVTHEITLFPGTHTADLDKKLRNLIETNFAPDTNSALLRAWFSGNLSLPVYSLNPDGSPRWHWLKAAGSGAPVSVVEQIWYDPATGSFARLFKQGDRVLYAMGFDGLAVYHTLPADNGRFEIRREPISEEFSLPGNPAEFLGITASFRDSMDRRNLPPVEEEKREQLPDGSWSRVYRLRWQGTDASHVFRVDDKTNTVRQIDSVAYGQTIQRLKRLSSGSADRPGISWNLAEVAGVAVPQDAGALVTQGMVRITAQQMADAAEMETFVFCRTPDWVAEQTFGVITDPAIPMGGVYVAFCRGGDGRNVALIQSQSLNRYLAAAFSMARDAAFRWTPRLIADNRFRLHDPGDIGVAVGQTGTDLISPALVFRQGGLDPGEYSWTYVLHSPTNTYLLLAVNGRIPDDELRELVGSLAPARFYRGPGQAIEWYVAPDPGSVTYTGMRPGEFLRDWLVLGAFPIFDDAVGFPERFADGETQLRALDREHFDISQFQPHVVVDGTAYQWELYSSPSEIVDLAWPLGQHDFADAYAWAQIDMPEETAAQLAIGDDDRIKVWLNGEPVHENRDGGHLVPDEALVPVTLRKGLNQLVLKIQNGITEWQFTCRFFESGYDPETDRKEPIPESAAYDGLVAGEFMKRWLLLEPIAACVAETDVVEAKAAFDRDHLPSYEQFEDTVMIGDGDRDWRAWTFYRSYTGIVDLHRAWSYNVRPVSECSVTYAWARVDMPEETSTVLGIGSDDAVKVWLNGRLIHENWIGRGAFPDNDRVKATFRKGPNQLVLKILSFDGRWRFCCRSLTPPNASPEEIQNALGPPPPPGRTAPVDEGEKPDVSEMVGPAFEGPGWRIEAEDYDEGGEGVGHHDLFPGNILYEFNPLMKRPGEYRDDDVEIMSKNPGQLNVGFILKGEWLAYTMDVPATGTYDLELNVATTVPGRSIYFELDDRRVPGAVQLPVTGDWARFQVVAKPGGIHLTKGRHRLKMVFDESYMNVDWLQFVPVDEADDGETEH